jgi:hypothetical protein
LAFFKNNRSGPYFGLLFHTVKVIC